MDDLHQSSLLECVLVCMTDFVSKLNLPSSLVSINLESCHQMCVHDEAKVQPAVELLISAVQKQIAAFKSMNRGSPEPSVDESIVQITVSKQQLDKRIASFISHAQNAVDEQNVLEFCGCDDKSNSEESGCARTRARYKRRAANRTHMEVSRIENLEGPQMQVNAQGNWCVSVASKAPGSYPVAVQERLSNLEHHVGVSTAAVPKDVYERLKTIEDRVLYLESVSPEYFTRYRDEIPKRQKLSSGDAKVMSLDDIDDRIRTLRRNLLSGKVR